MKKEDVTVLAQLLTSMKNNEDSLEIYEKKKNLVKINELKREILRVQKEIDGIL
jgi:hypothetical protein